MNLSQNEKLYDLLKDRRPHSTLEILSVVYGGSHLGLARVSARVWDLTHGKWAGKSRVEINGWHDKENPTVYWYQIKNEPYPLYRIESKKIESREIIPGQIQLFDPQPHPLINLHAH